MKKFTKFLFIIHCFAIFGVVNLTGWQIFAAENAGSGKTVCKNAADERLIEVVYPEEGKRLPCEVQYTKAQQKKTIFTSAHEAGFCEKKAHEFAEKLAGMGFKCTE